jgi:hypothetical protein
MTDTAAKSVNTNVEARKRVLFDAVQSEVRGGWHVESQSDYHATLAIARSHRVRLHLFLSIITFGLWALFVWLPLSVFGRLNRKMVSIDIYGNVSVRRA